MQSYIAQLARVLKTLIITIFLLAPVIICNCFTSLNARLYTIIVATTTFIAILSSSTRAKTVKLVIAGATYVFISHCIIFNI
jgi:hypothetical protein